LGKRILFTDRTDLSDEQIIFGYRGQHHIERAFRDAKHLVGPMTGGKKQMQ